MSKQLKLFLEQALYYLTDDVWPPDPLVGQIAAEAKRLGIEPPIEYRSFTSPEGAPEHIRRCFAEEPDTVSVVTYYVRDPFDGAVVGFCSWHKKKPGTQFTPDTTLVEVFPVAAFPPSKQILRAIQAWIPYLEAKEQSPAASKPKAKRGKRAGESSTESKIVGALNRHHDYGNGKCGKYEPITYKELVELADVSKPSITRFFQKHFPNGGYKEYKRMCLLPQRHGELDRKLQILNREDPKERTYGSDPDHRQSDE